MLLDHLPQDLPRPLLEDLSPYPAATPRQLLPDNQSKLIAGIKRRLRLRVMTEPNKIGKCSLASGQFARFASLGFSSLPWNSARHGTLSYVQIGALSASSAALAGTEQLPVALLTLPALPPTGTGGVLTTGSVGPQGSPLLAVIALEGLLAGGGWLRWRCS